MSNEGSGRVNDNYTSEELARATKILKGSPFKQLGPFTPQKKEGRNIRFVNPKKPTNIVLVSLDPDQSVVCV